MPAHDTTTASPPSYRASPPKLIGGALCLDFVNTVEWRGLPDRQERLANYAELLAWAEAAGAIERKSRARLAALAKARPAAAAAVLTKAIALRETIAGLLGPGAPRPALLDGLNHWLARAPERTCIVRTAEGYGWRAAAGDEALSQPLWPVAWSAAELLTSGRAARVRACADRRCGWMYIDASRAMRRRWCSMEGCGNRAKALRHYRKRRAA